MSESVSINIMLFFGCVQENEKHEGKSKGKWL